ncbi:cytochrome P450 [Amycolatopsis cihanbeyliensis]|uniref:Pentalenene oxygenase n=1 Tax=Amycolatopsis cihanbeyliensis TaxID=1128664 RepID=A0A542DCC3_AMYCI|nr:cytochrome P450 [Amycolatopsis cihanbeyliensis]TQJ00719.1 pentalenene oxygenase [Amycolatopsis cihanbeyliensis]
MSAPPVASGRLPALGHLPHMRRDRRLAFLDSLRRQGSVVRLKFGPRTAYVVTEAEMAREVLVVQARHFDKGEAGAQLGVLLGNGLLTSERETHRRQRLLLQPFFHRSRMAGYAEAMRQEVEELSNTWREGQHLDVRTEMYGLLLGITARALLPSSLGTLHAEFRRDFPLGLREVQRRMFNPVRALTGRVPTPRNRRHARLLARLHGAVAHAIATYRGSGVDDADMLATLLAARDPDTGDTLSETEIRDQVMTMLATGGETSANTLAWAFHELGRDPDLGARLHSEVDEALGGRSASYDDLPRLGLTARVISEVLRRYPPAWMISRRAVADVELGGYRVPAGSPVLVIPYIVQHDPAVFDDPHRFDPDRWLPERAAGPSREAFLAFGGGVRKCIADQFALIETTLALATLAGSWRLRPLPGHPVRPLAATTLLPDGLVMRAERR